MIAKNFTKNVKRLARVGRPRPEPTCECSVSSPVNLANL